MELVPAKRSKSKSISPIKQLFRAIKYNDPPTVEAMLNADPSLAQTYYQMPGFCKESVLPVHAAAAYGHVRCFKAVLKKTPNANALTKEQYNTPMHYAANVRVIEALYQYRGSSKKENKWGVTPFAAILFDKMTTLRVHCESSKEKLVRSLLLYWTHIDEKNSKGETLLHMAVTYDSIFGARFLLGQGARLDVYDANGQTPFDRVIQGKHNPEMLRLFEEYGMFFFPRLSIGALFNKNDVAFLNRWAPVLDFIHRKNRNKDMDKHHSSWMSSGLVCNKYGCIISDISQKDLERYFSSLTLCNIESLLQKKLSCAKNLILLGSPKDLCRVLKEHSFLTTYQDYIVQLIITAINENEKECLDVILDTIGNSKKLKNCVAEQHDNCGGTFLHLAVWCNNSDVLPCLIPHVDCLAKDMDDKIPLQIAMDGRQTECIRALRNVMARQYCTALFERDNARARKLLKQFFIYHKDPDFFYQEQDGFFFLCMLCQFNSQTSICSIQLLDCIEYLLDKGISITQEDAITGKPFLRVAIENKDFELAQLFLRRGSIVTNDVLKIKHIKMPQELDDDLRLTHKKQNCCVCCTHPDDLGTIPCKRKHNEFLCVGCHQEMRTELCPLCLESLIERS